MAGQQPKLVNKQFNSPIGLYSPNNIKEILDRESEMLANGAMRINFHNPMASKPANLHNSAVLRMLEEEESKQRNGQSPGVKRVAWPPPREGEDDDYSEQEPVQAQGGAQYSSQSPGLQKSHQPPPTPPNTIQVARPTTPQTFNRSTPQSPIVFNKPASPAFNQGPATFSPNVVAKNWAPVQSPTSPQPQYQGAAPQFQQPHQQYQQQPKPFQPPQQQFQAPQQYQAAQQPHQFQAPQQYQTPQQFQAPLSPQIQQQQPQQRAPVIQNQVAAVPQQQQTPQYQPAPVKQVEPPPTIITLRPKVPISQAPAPLITSQPATATLKGGKNLRGDMKWPPENVKERMDAENKARVDLAQGPACRPRKVNKDYSSFFAQHALNSTYPGYKIPPGTQYYDHHPVM